MQSGVKAVADTAKGETGRDLRGYTDVERARIEFFRSILEILDRGSAPAFSEFGISPVMLARLKAVARRRIWLSS
jgi:hypothetical protein